MPRPRTLVAAAAALAAAAWLRPPRRRPQPLEVLTGGDPRPVAGFGTVELALDDVDGHRRHAAVLLATTTEQVAQGLAGRTDLAGHHGMLFWLPGDTDMPFHMVNTPLPLTLVWFDRHGAWLGSTDMAPGGPDDTRLYDPPAPFRFALELPRGTAAGLGLGPGSRLDLAHLDAGG